jgi:hypothetical protein
MQLRVFARQLASSGEAAAEVAGARRIGVAPVGDLGGQAGHQLQRAFQVARCSRASSCAFRLQLADALRAMARVRFGRRNDSQVRGVHLA